MSAWCGFSFANKQNFGLILWKNVNFVAKGYILQLFYQGYILQLSLLKGISDKKSLMEEI